MAQPREEAASPEDKDAQRQGLQYQPQRRRKQRPLPATEEQHHPHAHQDEKNRMQGELEEQQTRPGILRQDAPFKFTAAQGTIKRMTKGDEERCKNVNN